ncbi:MAG: serine hydrolase, partial [Sandaracinus sp.]|nr:serine hydrolase [Sandaracinus sp.]
PPVVRLRLEDERTLVDAIEDALAAGDVPGAVVVLGDRQGPVFRRAFGARRLVPERAPMTEDTIFDLASVTKVFTTVAVLQLVERGALDLDAPVDPTLPELAGRGITARHLLTHTAGLRPVNPLSDYDDDRSASLSRALRAAPERAPGTYRYSDLGFLALGALVERLSGHRLDAHLQTHVFAPLGLRDTGFAPGPGPRVAPTERAAHRGDPAPIIHGEANDPRAWRLGGVAGHAGLFTTADDLARFAEALLRGGGPLLRPETVALLQRRVGTRGLGVDRDPREGEGWSAAAFGHGGYTGTWLWLDPLTGVYVVVLTHRVHPDGGGRAGPLRSAVARVANAAVPRARPPVPSAPRLGIDVLRAEGFARLRGRRVGLLTHDAGRARDGRRTAALLHDAPEVELAALFAPEHGLASDREGTVRDGRWRGVPVHGLFGARRAPPPETLEGLDLLLVDLQDVGVRFYTYASTLSRAMEAAAEADLPVWVLDRPNPLGGAVVSGPVVEDALRSFVNHHPLPIRHGLTLGELARLLAAEKDLDLDLEIVAVEGWRREERWEETGLRWVPPSPNLRTPTQTLLYPGLALLESTNVSVGRGTDAPFEHFGAPWLDPEALLAELPPLAGVGLAPTRFVPTARPYRGRACRGLRVTLTDPEGARPVDVGLALLRALARTHGDEWDRSRAPRMVGARDLVAALDEASFDVLRAWGAEERRAYLARRAPHLLYQAGDAGDDEAR